MYYRKCMLCGEKESATISLHNFPRDPQRKADWKNALNLKESELSPRNRICSLHFTTKSFVYEGSRCLNRNAVPSLNPSSSHKVSSSEITSIDFVDVDANSIEATHLSTILSNNGDITPKPLPPVSRNHSVSNRPNDKKQFKSDFKIKLRARSGKNRKQISKSFKKQTLQDDKVTQKPKLASKKSFKQEDVLTDKDDIKSIPTEVSSIQSSNPFIFKNITEENTSSEIIISDLEGLDSKNVPLLSLNDSNKPACQNIPILQPLTINDKMGQGVDHLTQILPTSNDLDFFSESSSITANGKYIHKSPDLTRSLNLECWVEDLEPCQLAVYKERKQAEEEVKNQIDDLIKSCQFHFLAKNEFVTAIEVFENTQNIIRESQSHTKSESDLSIVHSTDKKRNFTNMDTRLSLKKRKAIACDKKESVTQPSSRSMLSKKPLDQSSSITLSKQSEGEIKITPEYIIKEPSANKTYSRHYGKKSAAKSSDTFKKTTEENISNVAKKVHDNTNDAVGQSTLVLDRSESPLSLTASPCMRIDNNIDDRSELDSKINEALSCRPAELVVWLMKLGLLKSGQICPIHNFNDLTLIVDDDSLSRYPDSGGYVWTSECCPQKFMSVFSGSIFETAPHPPTVILRLLYHWACQSHINEITKLVNVNDVYVKGMYTWLRAVCTIATFSHIKMLGGDNSVVEVGLITLKPPGRGKYFMVEVLGVFERSSKLIRLQVFKFNTEKDKTVKCINVLQPLENWVHSNSTIAIDESLAKNSLHYFGYTNVIQSENANKNIMDYLRNVVTKMFQNTLSVISLQIFKQFLDELVWREWFGTTSTDAFNNLVTHIAELTKYTFGPSLIVRLNRVASNPFKISFAKKKIVTARSVLNHIPTLEMETEVSNGNSCIRSEENAESSSKPCDVCICGYANNDCNKMAQHLTVFDEKQHEIQNESCEVKRAKIDSKTVNIINWNRPLDSENNSVNKIIGKSIDSFTNTASSEESQSLEDQQLRCIKVEPTCDNLDN
ncbi:hypothetical protein GWI33_017047 [Rhynchophorus ferrugineus]|uniref:THAP-type domain-containing protein n=1 Tax=Rhynchophorus ferrugineus TaxID=354439 RepID=A0A834HZP8_RHYFE|nr:hypothetical protein GWI33_017047 [Rhynchophorus ferrugineus]